MLHDLEETEQQLNLMALSHSRSEQESTQEGRSEGVEGGSNEEESKGLRHALHRSQSERVEGDSRNKSEDESTQAGQSSGQRGGSSLYEEMIHEMLRLQQAEYQRMLQKGSGNRGCPKGLV